MPIGIWCETTGFRLLHKKKPTQNNNRTRAAPQQQPAASIKTTTRRTRAQRKQQPKEKTGAADQNKKGGEQAAISQRSNAEPVALPWQPMQARAKAKPQHHNQPSRPHDLQKQAKIPTQSQTTITASNGSRDGSKSNPTEGHKTAWSHDKHHRNQETSNLTHSQKKKEATTTVKAPNTSKKKDKHRQDGGHTERPQNHRRKVILQTREEALEKVHGCNGASAK